jgi:hypothetical protein
MKKFITMLLASFIMVGSLVSVASANADKGQRYYLRYMKNDTGLNGSQFATQFTQSEWKEMFKDDGEAFIAKYSKKYPHMAEFFEGDRFKNRMMKDIKSFLIQYASDSGNIASC